MADDNVLAVYQQVCTSYQSSEAFRTKLLSFLPIVSGAGIFAFVQTNITDLYLVPIGLVGAALAYGLFLFEVGGLYWRASLMYRGMELERRLGVDGQFSLRSNTEDRDRPQQEAGYSVVRQYMWNSNRYGSSVVYASVITAWLFTSYAGFAGNLAHTAPVLSSPIVYAVCILLLFLSLIELIWDTRLKSFNKALDMLDTEYRAASSYIPAQRPLSAAVAGTRDTVKDIAQELRQARDGRAADAKPKP